ncbi:MAG: TauD/TfdA family dioxygenase [Streptosporangiaceae bacterium]
MAGPATATVRSDLEIAGPDGSVLRFPAVWLRDNCPCPSCRDPRTGQKLFGIRDLPDRTAVSVIGETEDLITVAFSPGGHRSSFPRRWLAEHSLGAVTGDPRTEDAKRLWPETALEASRTGWGRFRDDPACRAAALRAVLRDGFTLIEGVPVRAGLVAEVAGCFGYVRETNYGRIFDVRVEADPSHLASTGRALSPHTDNPYRDPVPTVQLLHCHASAAAGGDTVLVDGFAAAARLRAEDPDSFAVLSATPVPFGLDDAGTALRAWPPLIDLSPRGRIRGVHFNDRSGRALRAPYDEVIAFYAAYRRWAALLGQPDRAARLRLRPGDCLIFDNTRILHGRTAFTGSGERLLQGCYADLDALASTLAVLERKGVAA